MHSTRTGGSSKAAVLHHGVVHSYDDYWIGVLLLGSKIVVVVIKTSVLRLKYVLVLYAKFNLVLHMLLGYIRPYDKSYLGAFYWCTEKQSDGTTTTSSLSRVQNPECTCRSVGTRQR